MLTPTTHPSTTLTAVLVPLQLACASSSVCYRLTGAVAWGCWPSPAKNQCTWLVLAAVGTTSSVTALQPLPRRKVFGSTTGRPHRPNGSTAAGLLSDLAMGALWTPFAAIAGAGPVGAGAGNLVVSRHHLDRVGVPGAVQDFVILFGSALTGNRSARWRGRSDR
jgi:hypothetical protein